MLKKLLEKNRHRIDRELPNIEDRQFFSPALHALVRVIIPTFRQHIQGDVLDVGCGDMPFKTIIEEKASKYDTLDVEARTDGVTYIGSILDMNMIPDKTYDTIICLEVLEHVPLPFQGAKELNRALKTNGTLIMSVPHLSRLHEQPHDYYRYTHYGITALLTENGFEITEMKTCGGILCFLGHQISTVILCLFFHIPIIKHIIFFLNKWLIVKPMVCLDAWLFEKSVMPLGYLCVAKKVRDV